jgi:hypothetical protein
MTLKRTEHWDGVYQSKAETELSWFESTPSVSLAMLEAAGLDQETCVVDVGGGDSHLVDYLIQRGLHCLAVLDVSNAALERARARLGQRCTIPVWLATDVTSEWVLKPMDIWHDRAVFHFLTDPQDRAAYLARLKQTLKPNGTVILATFALNGPPRCSGLPVARYSPETLSAALGQEFRLVDAVLHTHQTPAGVLQSFQYSRFTREVPS